MSVKNTEVINIFIFAIIFLSLILLFVLIGIICNHRLVKTEIKVHSKKLPKGFDGFKILQISDLHNCAYSKRNRKLLRLIKDSKPDIIAITGDMIDSRKTKPEVALNLARNMVKIAPCYYVTGNHEARLKEEATQFIKDLQKTGVTYLDNACEEIKRNNETILLLGVNDPFTYWTGDPLERFNRNEVMAENLSKITDKDEPKFRVLLSHRPETFDVYSDFSIDLALTGHAHGGQIRLPFIDGLFAPCQGLFPKLTSGLHKKGNAHLVVSRGLGNSSFPFRIFNPPEVILITLKSE